MAKTKGDGSIRSKGKGVWEVRVAFGKDPITGKYRSVSRTVHGTKAQAAKVRDELRKQHENGLSYDGSRMTFEEFAMGVWLARREKSCAETGKPAKTTVSDNRSILETVCKHIGSVRLTSLDHYAIDKLFDKLNDERDKPLTGSRLKKYYVVLSGVFKLALKYDLVIRNPMTQVDAPTCEESKRNTLEWGEARQLVAKLDEAEARAYARIDALEHGRDERGCGDERTRITGIDAISRLVAVRLALNTGARRGEILALNWASVDFDNRRIIIDKSYTVDGDLKSPKTSSGVRVVPVDKPIIEHLRAWKANQARYLDGLSVGQTAETPVVCSSTGGHISTSNFSRWWASHRDELGCAGLRFHELRHTHASLQLAKGTPAPTVAKRLGHSKVSTTFDFYAHSTNEEDEKAGDLFGEIVTSSRFKLVS